MAAVGVGQKREAALDGAASGWLESFDNNLFLFSRSSGRSSSFCSICFLGCVGSRSGCRGGSRCRSSHCGVSFLFAFATTVTA